MRNRDETEKFIVQDIQQEEIKAPTAEDLEVFRDQLRSKVVGDVDIDAKTRLELHSQKDGSEPRRTSRDRVLCRSRKYPAHYPGLGFGLISAP